MWRMLARRPAGAARYAGGALYVEAWVVLLLFAVLWFFGGSPRPGPSEGPSRGAGLAGRRILIDPGHGGIDPGAQGRSATPEKAITWDVAVRLATLLRARGSQVGLTRSGDRTVSLGERVSQAGRLPAWDVMISLHANSSPNPSASGIATYAHSPRGTRLARAIHAELATMGLPDLGVRDGDFFVLRNSPVPSVLVELGFLTHPADAARLNEPSFRERVAQAIARGLAVYFTGGIARP